jgi:hypothetical protein
MKMLLQIEIVRRRIKKKKLCAAYQEFHLKYLKEIFFKILSKAQSQKNLHQAKD